MEQLDLKERWMRYLPGRLRAEVYGLKGDRAFSALLEQKLSCHSGIIAVRACADTGRLLVQFDEKKLSCHQLCRLLTKAEEEQFMLLHPHIESNIDPDCSGEVASTVVPVESGQIPDQFSVVASTPSVAQRPPVMLTASVIGLGVLGAKQLIAGRGALARSPALFHAAAVLSIVTGYPSWKKGFERFSKEGKFSADFVLSSAALALALVRGNLLTLAAVSMIQYLQWQRTQNQIPNEDPSLYLSPKTKAYARRAEKVAFGLAGLTYILTRNPLVTVGVLLAANPRPCLAAEEYNWKQAENTVRENGLFLPENSRLGDLTAVDTLLVEDTALLFSTGEQGLTCITEQEEDKLWCVTGSLMEKTSHPLRSQLLKRAGACGRTRRTAFDLLETEEGITGTINGQEVHFGSRLYMQKHKVDCRQYELIAKRQKKAGCQVYFVAKNGKCLGLILNQCPLVLNQAGVKVEQLQQKLPQLKVSFLADSVTACNHSLMMRNGWEVRSHHVNRLADVQGNILVLRGDDGTTYDRVPTVRTKQLKQLSDLIDFALDIERLNDRHRRVTLFWNIIGTALVIPGRLAAPVANLISDGLKLTMLTAAKKLSAIRAIDTAADRYNTKIFNYERVSLASLASRAKPTDHQIRPDAIDWHSLDEQEIINRLQTNHVTGLSGKQATELHAHFGVNQIIPPAKTHWLLSFARQFKEFTTLILLGTASVSILSGDIFDGLAMIGVLLANATISVIQERRAGKVVDALNQFQPPVAKVIREGKELELEAPWLVPGDIVLLEAGDLVPADIRLLSDWNLEINEAALTGESLAVVKRAGTHSHDTSLAERSNMAYMGTNVTRGKGIGVVVSTGMNTEIGYLTSLLKEENKQLTPLQEKVTSISKKFVKGAFIAGGLVFVVGLLRGNTVAQMVSTAVALIASAIPEGLPVTITIALSAGIFRMAKRNAVIRKLSALETLGRVTVICSDKTGTLTKNEMTVTKIATVQRQWEVTGDGYAPVGSLIADDGVDNENQELQKIVQISTLCNNSQLISEGGQWSIKGDPTEGALLTLARKTSFAAADITSWKRVQEIPFDSLHGSMSVVCHDGVQEDECYLFSKGSIEAILKKCAYYQQNGQSYPLSEEIKRAILRQNESFATDALRVLGFAYRKLAVGENRSHEATADLTFVGMVGMIDPPKSEVQQAIHDAYSLGVKPVMITGDHPITAIAIGRQLGMYRDGDTVITGGELEKLSEDELVRMVSRVSIFARVSPEHKLRIVQAYQTAGHVVAMTGDGVNDAPAIKKADVGIAMGQTGTEVTKQTADMVLKEDHFGSIVDGVKESRTIISNIRKAIGCLLTGNLAEILVSGLAVVVGLPMPLVPVQILLMNMLTDALPASVLAVNPGNKKLNTQRQDIVDKQLYQKVAIRGVVLGLGSLALFATSLAMGAPLPVARTMAFATLVAGQLMQTFSWRQESGQPFSNWIRDKFFVGALGISWSALLAAIYVPALSGFFHTAPLQIHQLLLVILVGGSVSLLSKPFLQVLAGEHPVRKPLVRPLAA